MARIWIHLKRFRSEPETGRAESLLGLETVSYCYPKPTYVIGSMLAQVRKRYMFNRWKMYSSYWTMVLKNLLQSSSTHMPCVWSRSFLPSRTSGATSFRNVWFGKFGQKSVTSSPMRIIFSPESPNPIVALVTIWMHALWPPAA